MVTNLWHLEPALDVCRGGGDKRGSSQSWGSPGAMVASYLSSSGVWMSRCFTATWTRQSAWRAQVAQVCELVVGDGGQRAADGALLIQGVLPHRAQNCFVSPGLAASGHSRFSSAAQLEVLELQSAGLRIPPPSQMFG